ncbi:MAG: DUF1080 domain-containing protein [Planctomyces sp.]|nr:DUF1080 domain-containing protein [Planctomyces sp.]
MMFNMQCLFLCALAIPYVTVGTLNAATLRITDEPVEQHELFDGISLTGWDHDPAHWRVENGSIVGEIPPGTSLDHNTWIVWRGGELIDFDLRLQVRLTGEPAANSGIQFRCQVRDVNHVSGYQADLDQGATWLGRIYDEHGRALLVERGTRVHIQPDGKSSAESFAPAHQYAVLFRDNDWNEYRIIGIQDRIAVFVNGTLFSELWDEQTGEQDLRGQLAFQLHSGPATRVEFRDIRLEVLEPDDQRLRPFRLIAPEPSVSDVNTGITPTDADGNLLNLGFESGDLRDWTVEGNAFDRQPVQMDGISRRWPDQQSNKEGLYFFGGYEHVQDRGTGSLTSVPFKVTHPWGSILVGGGKGPATRVELVRAAEGSSPEEVLFTASGSEREQMQRAAFDLRKHIGEMIFVRIIDESSGGWGHLNVDDFRFHSEPPADSIETSEWRSIRNPVLQHLIPNSISSENANSGAETQRGIETTSQMFVPEGFSVDVIAAEPVLHQPMAFTFDEKGRIWVVEGHCYPQKRPADEGLDKILIFADNDRDGHFEDRKVFFEGLNLVSGLEVGYGGVWIGAAPELLFIPDTNHDDLPDGPPQVLLDGFGYADTHETLNSFQWGPDGWLYGNQGVFNTSQIGKPGGRAEDRQTLSAGVWRFHPLRHEFEVFAHGGSNQWGLDYDDMGQWFMTHCRSFWGKGGTTHVMQGGHYWNQVNSGYADFVSSEAIADLAGTRNYLLASARYDHGAGGAGKPGTDEVFGGHSHVGTMIYLGDNWPSEFRNHLMTHNLHGHQINHQMNLREQGGYRTVHAGQDLLFCADRQFIGVDLQYGPDGAVYISDWYDPRHCHNPDVEQWDRGNGRIYRMRYDSTWKAASVDYSAATDDELVAAQLHLNDWHARTARRILHERSADGPVSQSAIDSLIHILTSHPDTSRRLRAMWALHCIGQLQTNDPKASPLKNAFSDNDEYVRSWAVLLSAESQPSETLRKSLVTIANQERSLMVMRALASVIQRLPSDTAWQIAESLSSREQIAEDRDLPSLLWFGIAQLVPNDLNRAQRLADSTPVPAIRHQILWYTAKTSDKGRDNLVARISESTGTSQHQLVQLLELSVRGMRKLNAPQRWQQVSASLYDSEDATIRAAAESIGRSFGDQALYARIRQRLDSDMTSVEAKRRALAILADDTSPENLDRFLRFLDSPELALHTIPLLRRYDDISVAEHLVDRLNGWPEAESAAAMEALTGRASWATILLDQISADAIPRSRLTAYHARQIASLGDQTLTDRLQKDWGALRPASDEVRAEVIAQAAAYKAAPLWAFSAENGALHFKKHCAVCHLPNQQSEAIAPRLAGSGARGIDYIVENVLNPNAVIGRDYQARIIATHEGQVLNGLIEKETDSAIILRTLTSSVTIPRDDIEEINVSTSSFMPEGLLKTLNDRERIELFKYLMGL